MNPPAELSLGVGLVVAELLRGELDVARLVHAVHVTEGSGDREALADLIHVVTCGGFGLVGLWRKIR